MLKISGESLAGSNEQGFDFDILNNLANQTSIQFTSMGMTSDYLLAIKNKASYVRVGSAIFGKRSVGNNNF